jgi:hypothetical protein
MLQPRVDIEGLASFENVDFQDDTPPNLTRIWFDVVLEEMPFLSQLEGRLVKKPFVHRFFEMNLGRDKGDRRVKDDVELDEATGKWKVKRLNPNPKHSDILKHKDAWNAFARGQTYEVTGTPLAALFPSEAGKVDRYKYHHISVVEQLANLSATDAQELGMGTGSDVQKAKDFLERTKGTGAVLTLNRELEEERKHRMKLEETVQDLTAKLTQLLESQLGTPKKKGAAKESAQEQVGA